MHGRHDSASSAAVAARLPGRAAARACHRARSVASGSASASIYEKFRSRHSARQARLDLRAERLRQEHPDQHDRRADSARIAATILFDGKPLHETKFGYVFQNYREALFPWMRPSTTSRYPLKLRKVPKAEAARRVEQAGRASRRQDRPQSLSLRDVRRTAAARLDHAGARRRAGDPVPRRAFFRARLRDDPVHARAVAAHLRWRPAPPWSWCRTISKRRSISPTMSLLLSRRPGTDRRFRPAFAAARPRNDATLSRSRIRPHQGALPRQCSSARCAA